MRGASGGCDITCLMVSLEGESGKESVQLDAMCVLTLFSSTVAVHLEQRMMRVDKKFYQHLRGMQEGMMRDDDQCHSS